MRYVGFLTAVEVLSIAPPLSALSNSSTDDGCYVHGERIMSRLSLVCWIQIGRCNCIDRNQKPVHAGRRCRCDVIVMFKIPPGRQAGELRWWASAFVSHQQVPAVLVSHKESGSDDALLFVSGSAVFACLQEFCLWSAVFACLQEKGMKKKIRLFVDTET